MTTAHETKTGNVRCIGENETLADAASKLSDFVIGCILARLDDQRSKEPVNDRVFGIAYIKDCGGQTTATTLATCSPKHTRHAPLAGDQVRELLNCITKPDTSRT